MKTILIPTDFSENAANAFRYGIAFAKKLSAKIILYNVIHVPTDVVPPIIATSFDEMEKKALTKLENWKYEYLKHEKSVEVQCIVETGFAGDEIILHAKKRNVDLIIMGTKGATGLFEKMMGSITSNVIEKAPCPVLAIPENISLNDIKRIVFATDYRDNDFESLVNITEIAKNFNAEILVLHVALNDKDFELENAHFDAFTDKVNNTIPYHQFAFHLLKGKNVEEELSHFLKEVHTDILVVSTAKRNLIAKLFNHSVTKGIAQHPEIPLFAFHVKNFANIVIE